MSTQQTKETEKGNLFQRLLAYFQLNIDDLSAKPRHPVLCWFNIAALAVYHGVSIGLLWFGDGALISTLLNGLCVLRGFFKVTFDQRSYRAEVHSAWNNCTTETGKFIEDICHPYQRMRTLEFVTLVLFVIMFLAIHFKPGEYPVELVGTFVLLAVFIGDCVDVLTDMYQAHPVMPSLPQKP